MSFPQAADGTQDAELSALRNGEAILGQWLMADFLRTGR